MKNKLLIVFSCLMAIIFCMVIWVYFEAYKLRPAGDDYCYGAIAAEFGLFGGVYHWWNTWSGFIFAMFSGTLLVGLPLAFLPFNIASAICFILASLGMGLVIACINNKLIQSAPRASYILCLFMVGFYLGHSWLRTSNT
ncbi:hypothetical protein G6694_09650 [Polynucleobacter paneuropaeus]|nr:hypothetical protein [Polynucleobacter paneuropaeus]